MSVNAYMKLTKNSNPLKMQIDFNANSFTKEVKQENIFLQTNI